MRIATLNLLAYGHFDNKLLQFGNEPGFHLIYGDNEAGKSTALRALSSVLFGYPHSVIDGFKYDPKDIALGIELIGKSGQTLSFTRKRRGQKVLSTSDGKPLDQSTVTAFLGGVDRDVFERLFALDHTRLHEHAKSLLAEGGALGLSLAEAGSGIAGLKGVLDHLGNERSDLFLPSGAKPTLNRLMSQFADFKTKARRYTVSLNEYKKRDKEIDDITSAISDARARITDISKTIRQLERIQRTLPQKRQHTETAERLAKLTNTPDLPDGVTQKRIKAQSDRDSAATDLDIATKAIAELENTLAAVRCNYAILDRLSEIEALSGDRSVVENADRDLPKREAELNQYHAAARETLAKSELVGNPERLGDVLPSAIKRKAIETLATKSTALAGQLEAAKQAQENAHNALEAGKTAVKNTARPIDTVELEQAWRIAEKLGPITEQITKRRRTVERKIKALEDGIVALNIGTNSLSALRSFVVPAEKTIDRYKKLFADSDGKALTIQTDCDRLRDEIKEISQQIDELTGHGIVLTTDDINKKREERDQTWGLIRDGYINKSPSGQEKLKEWVRKESVADYFESQIADADKGADMVREHVKEATELSIAIRNKVDREARLALAIENLEGVTRDRQALSDEWGKLWGPFNTAVQGPDEMIEWIRRRDALLQVGNECEALKDENSESEDTSKAAGDRLTEALKRLGETVTTNGLDELRQAADLAIKRNATLEGQFAKAIQAVETLEVASASADREVNKLSSQFDDHSKEWRAALLAGGLGADLTVESASVILGYMNELDGLKSSIESTNHRIATMREDRAKFTYSLSPLKGLIHVIANEDAIATCRRLEVTLKEAQAADGERKTLSGHIEIRKKAKQAAEEKLQRAKAELESLCKLAECSEPDDLVAIEKDSDEKRRLTDRLEEIESRLQEIGDGFALKVLFAECDSVVADELPSKLSELSEENAALESKLEQDVARRAEQNKEREALLGQDQAADYTQSAAMVGAEAAIAAQSYVEATTLEILLRQAIEIYRDRNQGPILARAKTLFSDLTNGAYRGLRADVDDKGAPVLIAEHTTRGSLEIAALSDGTVDPLYLALRLGAIQEYNATREPLPFIADDLLLSLGNRRARATLKTLGELGKDGQVLFFTHHEHMIDLARDVLGKDILREHAL